jgi:cytidine deaminase
MEERLRKKIIKQAQLALAHAYAPYSGYRVGAALLGKSGKIYTGCNIENSSFGATVCAERVACYKAMSEGHKSFKAIAVIAQGGKKPIPCGICRQVLWELAGDLEILIAHRSKVEVLKLSDLYPDPF